MAELSESTIVVAAPPSVVLEVIADVEAYPEWTGGVRSAEILEDHQGWAERARFSIDAGPIKDSYVLAYDWDVDEDGTGTVSWDLVEAGVLKAMNGSYTLNQVQGGTEVIYRLSVDVAIPMLGMLRRKAERTIIDSALKGLKKRAEG